MSRKKWNSTATEEPHPVYEKQQRSNCINDRVKDLNALTTRDRLANF